MPPSTASHWPVTCRAASEAKLAARDDLIERLCDMPPIPAALDALIAGLGPLQRLAAAVPGATGTDMLHDGIAGDVFADGGDARKLEALEESVAAISATGMPKRCKNEFIRIYF